MGKIISLFAYIILGDKMYAAILNRKLVLAIKEAEQVNKGFKKLNQDYYTCPSCRKRMILIISEEKLPFFKHFYQVKGTGEKEEHYQSKQLLCTALKANGINAEVEVPLFDHQINRAAIGIFVCNLFAMEMSVVGLLAIAFAGDLATASVPMLVLVQNGAGAGVLTPIISLLIILGAISTAVNMISGIVTRCVNAVERRMSSEEQRAKGHLGRNAVFTLIFTFLAFAIAQFGLMAVVKKGYAYLGYAALVTLFIPFVIHALATKGKEI